ncbi:hypothetical protein DFA_04948 [Cavenderia fasciculata]|uniref:Transmembrane protein n=1 Tax=Cavenderia fasciculata TaxID=261658 RepID=F4PMM1_CACFS|nr:uncharacterized protein DFA_04948 [Cavenderia fasciculata]EGG22818.1 hypothetical protein DFA_04948 [Cavenderia fasciculata]|eukprot:XP_004360669.1 hypothetical protein DFA_04948 [Cavenderia fasciculata]
MSKWPNLFLVIISIPPSIFFVTCLFVALTFVISKIKWNKFDMRWVRSSIRVNLVMLNFLYLPLCIYILQNYSCTYDENTDQSYMSFFPWISCSHDANYQDIFKVTVSMTVLYIIGIPALFAYLLFNNRNRLDDPNVLIVVGSIYIDYRKKVWWYELVGLARRFVMAVSLALINPKSSFSVFVVLLVIGSSIISQLWARPFIYRISNFTELLGNSVLLFAYICVLILSSLKSSYQYDAIGIEVILSIVIVMYTVYLGIIFLFSLKYFLPKRYQLAFDNWFIKRLEDVKLWKMQYDQRNQIDPDDEQGYEPKEKIDPLFTRSATQQVFELKQRRLTQSTDFSVSDNNNTHTPGESPVLKPYKSEPNFNNLLDTTPNPNSNQNNNNNNNNQNNNIPTNQNNNNINQRRNS